MVTRSNLGGERMRGLKGGRYSKNKKCSGENGKEKKNSDQETCSKQKKKPRNIEGTRVGSGRSMENSCQGGGQPRLGDIRTYRPADKTERRIREGGGSNFKKTRGPPRSSEGGAASAEP